MSRATTLVAVLVTIGVVLGIGFDWSQSDSTTRRLWQQAVVPGALSQSHAFLSNQCVACHVTVKGVKPALCISCHAANTALLQRQPTAFHANVQVCTGCHVEHQATVRMPTTMDHSLLAKVGHSQLAAGLTAGPPGASRLPVEHPGMAANESMLDCASCHATKDRHQGLLGSNCVQCHSTSQWTIAEFRHPSVSSTECAQCHQPPPSHNMMHFSMMSAPIARQPNANVNQCFLCHQTTSWNDIKGVGRVKHH